MSYYAIHKPVEHLTSNILISVYYSSVYTFWDKTKTKNYIWTGTPWQLIRGDPCFRCHLNMIGRILLIQIDFDLPSLYKQVMKIQNFEKRSKLPNILGKYIIENVFSDFLWKINIEILVTKSLNPAIVNRLNYVKNNWRFA